MAADAEHASGGYLRRVLVDGIQPFRYRSRVRSLLGLPQDTGIKVSFATALPGVGFIYARRPLAGERYMPDEWLAGSSGGRTYTVEESVDLSWVGPHEDVPAVGPSETSPDTARRVVGAAGQGPTAARISSPRESQPPEPQRGPAAGPAEGESLVIPGITTRTIALGAGGGHLV